MSELRMIPVDDIQPNPDQPRVEFDAMEIQSLAESIREHGLIHPIAVEECDGHYVLIDGERRWRAVKLLGLALIKAVVTTYDDAHGDKFAQAMTANLQRTDLNPIEEALAYQKLKERGYTEMAIGRMAGRSNSHVNLRVKLLELEPEVQELFAARKLPLDPGVLFSLFKLPPESRVSMARGFALKGTTGANIKKVVEKFLSRMDLPDVPLRGGRRSPAALLSEATGAGGRMISLAGVECAPVEWEQIEKAANETCEACDLNDMASAQMCKDCPAVELLKRLSRIMGEKEQE